MKKISDYVTEESIENFIKSTCKKRNGKKAYVCDMRQFYNWSRLSEYRNLDLEVENILLLYQKKLLKSKIKENTIKRKLTVLKEYIIFRSIPLPGMIAIRSKESDKIFVYDQASYEFFYQDDFLVN